VSDIVYESRTKWCKTGCGTINVIIDWPLGEKEFGLGTIERITIKLGKNGSCLSHMLGMVGYSIEESIKGSAHKGSKLKSLIEGFNNGICHMEDPNTNTKSCMKGLAEILRRFFVDVDKLSANSLQNDDNKV
jgi:hypothetical protein